MAIRRVRLLGDPVLRSRSASVTDPRSPAVRVVVDDLKETLRDLKARHGMGRALAAPQIGAPMSIVYVEIDRPWVLINPEIVDVGTEDFAVWDDCFSFPDLMVRVQRAFHVSVRYQDLRGKIHTVELDGDIAELIQHEIDHLEGVLAVDRPVGLDPFCLREEWNQHYSFLGRYGSPTARVEPVST
ncbi:MAG: peptide deformylase [Gemmatimonadetes bacterium]|nr:peptide deformylase [Gemmatimonadota bacterium]